MLEKLGALKSSRACQPHGGVLGLVPVFLELWRQVGVQYTAFAELRRRPARVLHLFDAAGGFTLAAAQAVAAVAHVDASADAIKRAREHVALNALANRDIR